MRVVARRGATTIAQTRHGLVLAAAGVDESNTAPGTVVLLPEDPDESARRLRKALHHRTGRTLGVIVTDTMGRPWRAGQTDNAIGAAGVLPVVDYRGERRTFGNILEVTVAAVADEIAAAADLVKGKSRHVPAALVRGLDGLVTEPDGPGARALIRAADEDMFRFGSADVPLARRTIREFTADPVDAGAVRRAVAAALTAPAPHHSEPWRFVICETAAARTRLLDAMRDAWAADLRGDGFTEEQITRRLRRGDVLRAAPLIIVPCLVTDAAHDYPDEPRAGRSRPCSPCRWARRCRTCSSRWPWTGSARRGSPARCSARTSRPGRWTCRTAGGRWERSPSAARPGGPGPARRATRRTSS